MSTWKIDSRFQTPGNAGVMNFLRRSSPSAHSDVADELVRSAKGVPGVFSYCPDPQHYAFVVLHREDHTIIGLAWGQSALAYRMPEPRVAGAVERGAAPVPELGPGWVRMEPWSDAETLAGSRKRLACWCRIAAGISGSGDSA